MNSEPLKPKPKRQKMEDRIAELENQLTDTGKILETYTNQLKYAKADLDNFQKQTQRRIEEATERANTRILSQLIIIADELRIVATNSKDEGVSMIYAKLLKLLENEGVKPIDATGKPFDPFKHEALMEVEVNDCPSGIVVEEIRSGYTYKDKVLRASMVKVAGAPSVKSKEE
jgi:molecular chaperone GrpE